MAKLAIPTVHLNGTSQESLLNALMTAIGAAQALQDAMRWVHPHARDYYVQDAGAINIAIDQHRTRCRRIDQIEKELTAIALAVQDRTVTSDVEAAD